MNKLEATCPVCKCKTDKFSYSGGYLSIDYAICSKDTCGVMFKPWKIFKDMKDKEKEEFNEEVRRQYAGVGESLSKSPLHTLDENGCMVDIKEDLKEEDKESGTEYERTFGMASNTVSCITTRAAAEVIVKCCGDYNVDEFSEPCKFCGVKSWSSIKKLDTGEIIHCCPSCINDVERGNKEI